MVNLEVVDRATFSPSPKMKCTLKILTGLKGRQKFLTWKSPDSIRNTAGAEWSSKRVLCKEFPRQRVSIWSYNNGLRPGQQCDERHQKLSLVRLNSEIRLVAQYTSAGYDQAFRLFYHTGKPGRIHSKINYCRVHRHSKNQRLQRHAKARQWCNTCVR